MHEIAKASENHRRDLFEATADSMTMHPAIIEKDFWVCWLLDVLFASGTWGQHLMFKGGTSLAKVYKLIHRFSEDIDLILDWNLIGISDGVAWVERSRRQKDLFTVEANATAEVFLRDKFVPELSKELLKFGIKGLTVEKDPRDEQCVNIIYPRSFEEKYIRPEVRLEIGPLAGWVPHANFSIKPYASEYAPHAFKQSESRVRAIKAERTFWEKATILHREANRPTESILPARYSRHYYDLVMMAASPFKAAALADLSLLKTVVDFKQQFYYCAWAKYGEAKPGTLRLIPSDAMCKVLEKDYEAMKVMIFHDAPSFENIMEQLRRLEQEINSLA
jgi:hypothetical protein